MSKYFDPQRTLKEDVIKFYYMDGGVFCYCSTSFAESYTLVWSTVQS